MIRRKKNGDDGGRLLGWFLWVMDEWYEETLKVSARVETILIAKRNLHEASD
jgi:hypothetical protein